MKKLCSKCGLSKIRKRIITSRGYGDPDIAFIIEYPEPSDDLTGKALSGPVGRMFDSLLIRTGISGYTIVPIVRCRTEEGESPEASQVLACSSKFLEEIRRISPKRTVFLGKNAYRWYNKEFHVPRQIMHPSAVFLSGEMRSPYLLTFLRQLQEVKKGIA